MDDIKTPNELCKSLYAKNDVSGKIFQDFIRLEFKYDSCKSVSDKSLLIHDYLKCLNQLKVIIRESTEQFNRIFDANIYNDEEMVFLSICCNLIITFIEKYLYISKKIQLISLQHYKQLNLDSRLLSLAYLEQKKMYDKYRSIYVKLKK